MEKAAAAGDWSLSPDYAMTKANLAYFRPELFSQSAAIFSEIKKQQEAFKDQFGLDALDLPFLKRGKEDFRDQLRSGPAIFVSCHIGPVGPLLSYIAGLGVNLMLLFDAHHYALWAGRYRSLYEAYISKNKLDQQFEILDTEELGSGMKMARAMRDGWSLLLFIDGNTGVGGLNRQDEKLCPVDFFGKKIFARRGIGYFSQMFDAPVIPLVTYGEKQEGTEHYFLEISEPLLPDKTIPKEAFRDQLAQQLFRILEQYILRYPDQWQGWLYFQHFIVQPETGEAETVVLPGDETGRLRFNAEQFSFCRRNGEYFLLRHAAFSYHPLTEDVYRLLAGFREPQTAPKNVSPGSILQLLRKGILRKT